MILNMDKIQFESRAEIGTILNNPVRPVGRGCSSTYGSNDVAKRKSCAGDSDRRKMGRD